MTEKLAPRQVGPADIGLTDPRPGIPMSEWAPVPLGPDGFATRPPDGMRPNGKQGKGKKK